MLLIHPPVSKPCEPPAGIGKLCGFLRHHDIKHTTLDANLEGLLYLLKHSPNSSDTWTLRAWRHLSDHLASFKTWKGYRNHDRYKRAVKDTSRLLDLAGHPAGVRLGLANYESNVLSPARSSDLMRAAESPEGNPFYPYFQGRLVDLLEEKQPSMVGFSLNYLSQVLTTFAMVGFLRRECPGLALALGGGLVTSWMRRPARQNPFGGLVDHLIPGPGETLLLEIDRMSAGLPKEKPQEVGKGIVAAAKDVIPAKAGIQEETGFRVRPGMTSPAPLTSPCVPERECAPNYSSFPSEDYFSPGPILPYSASSGCYWSRCAFCPERAEGNPYRPIPSEEVLSDLHVLVEQVRPVLIHLLDNAISPSLMKAISEDPPGAPWYGFARITHHLTDLDFCRALKKSGCVMLQLGVESGDQDVLDRMEKGVDLGEASLALRTLTKAGIATYVYLLFGTPWEREAEARKTLEFTARHQEAIGFLNLAVFNLPVHSQESSLAETESFYEGDLSLYTDFRHPHGWDRKSVRQFLDKEFKRHPAVAPILRRDPPVFTSNHAPLLVMG
jgi:radical SAM superfamily enzyme YgiQ (UPF0313 family)